MRGMPRTVSCLTAAVADALRVACAQDFDHRQRIVAAHEAMSRSVVEGYDLDAMWRESDPDLRLPGGYRRHQVVTDEDFGFTVVVLLWEPGAVTPIHDHATWCVFGMLEGRLEVTNYEKVGEDPGGPILLREVDRDMLLPATIGDNGDPRTEIHRVRNIGTERAISLHLYGSDLTKRKAFEGRAIKVEGKQACLAFQDHPAY